MSPYATVDNIPGPPFIEKNSNLTAFNINDSGIFLLSPGDYSIPVMTYCMESSSASPPGHTYTLNRIQGKLAPIIRELNLRGLAHYSAPDIQIVLWSLLSGLSYEEMTKESQKIIDKVIPEYRAELKESFLSSVETKLNLLSDLSYGEIPTLSDIPHLETMRNFRETLYEVGHDYEELSRLIDTTPSTKKRSVPLWTKLSENIYARFVTEGSFGDVGFLQVRVLPEVTRIINSESQKKYPLDITSLIANSNDTEIQPLSFTPLIGIGGFTAAPQIVINPRAAALLVALALAIYPMDWNEFFKLEELLTDMNDKNVKKEIEKGKLILRKEHDELEKPLKEAGIISGKDKKHSSGKNNTREYQKTGGLEQLQKDFDKMPGKLSKAQDGTEIKKLPDGTTIVKRPGNTDNPTLEIQPPKSDSKYPDPSIRVKVRY